jgi:hypothetical protein
MMKELLSAQTGDLVYKNELLQIINDKLQYFTNSYMTKEIIDKTL